jgi:hypothetical protein
LFVAASHAALLLHRAHALTLRLFRAWCINADVLLPARTARF